MKQNNLLKGENIMKIGQILDKIGDFKTKNGAAILTGVAVAGVFATVIASYKTAKKLDKVVSEHKEALKKAKEVKDEPKKAVRKVYFDTAKRLIPVVAPTLITGGITVGCIIGSHSKSKKAIMLLSTAYSMKDTRLKDIESKMTDVLGEKKAREVKDAVLKEKLKEDGPINESKVIFTGNGDVLCKDAYTGQPFYSNAQKIDKAVAAVSAEVRDCMYCSLNTFYEWLGLDCVPMGEDLGWTVDDLKYGMLPIEYTAILTEDDRPCLCLDYSAGLKHDYHDFY